MNALKTFSFEKQPVRSLMKDDAPWFVGRDVCSALAITDIPRSLARLDADERDNCKMETARGLQKVTIVSEPGVYRLVFTSRTDAAERFKRWLAHDVLPALRRRGTYRIADNGEETQLPKLSHGRVWGQPVSKVNAAARLIGVAGRIYGPEAARYLWEKERGLPRVRHKSVGALVGTASDDPQGCLFHLLRRPADRNLTVAGLFDYARHDSVSAGRLRSLGLSIDPQEARGVLAVANSHPFLAEAYAATQWADDWRLALCELPFARPSRANIGFGEGKPASTRAVLIPLETIARLRNPKAH